MKYIFWLFRNYLKSMIIEPKMGLHLYVFVQQISVTFWPVYAAAIALKLNVLTCDLIIFTFDLSTFKWGHGSPVVLGFHPTNLQLTMFLT